MSNMVQSSVDHDSFGNMLLTDNLTGNTPFGRDPGGNNRLTAYGLSYDANGCVATSNGHTIGYTAEGFLRWIDSYNTGSYLYDAEGQRTLAVRNNQTWNEYVYLNGQQMADVANTGTWTDHIYAGGKQVAEADSTGATRYYVDDQLGSTRLELDASGNVIARTDTTPFGMEIINNSTPNNYIGNQIPDGVTTRFHFTGKERDSESGLDYFGARYFASNMGRWMSPDWSAKAEPVPYARLGDPQSLNLYAYVSGHATIAIYPDGHLMTFQQFLHPGGLGSNPAFNNMVSFGAGSNFAAWQSAEAAYTEAVQQVHPSEQAQQQASNASTSIKSTINVIGKIKK